ncbi:hypothetical protein, partial [Cupriavidus gilardii]|uniref:hypothetical protein n=1 Tax=Cupriavidus gilardii TaxID=82541 RepID=UPI000A6B6692
LPADIAALLVLVVALSMVTTPLLLLAYDQIVAPRAGKLRQRASRASVRCRCWPRRPSWKAISPR